MRISGGGLTTNRLTAGSLFIDTFTYRPARGRNAFFKTEATDDLFKAEMVAWRSNQIGSHLQPTAGRQVFAVQLMNYQLRHAVEHVQHQGANLNFIVGATDDR